MDIDKHIALVESWLGNVYVESIDRRVDEMQTMKRLKDNGAPLSPTTDAELLRISVHEAAHAVVGQLCGLRITRACIRIDGSGAVDHEPGSDDNLLGPAITNLAGPCSEVIRGVDCTRQFNLAHSCDVLMAKANIERARARDPQLTPKIFASMSVCSVISNLPAILRVAGVLRSCGELDGAVIAALCGKPQ